MDSDIAMLAAVVQQWHTNRVEQLKLLADGNEKVFVEMKGGEKKIEVQGEVLKGVRLGATLALDLIKDLPFKYERTNEEE